MIEFEPQVLEFLVDKTVVRENELEFFVMDLIITEKV